MDYWLVMPAAGSGRRFGADLPKQYAPLCGRTVIEWSLSPFLADPRCRGIRVAIAADDRVWSTLPAARDARVATVTGGGARSDSVRAGLAALSAAPDDWVLVHDAARPCLDRTDVDALLAAAEAGSGALLALPVAETLKRDDGAKRATETVDRVGLWRAQTPQLFTHGMLSEALGRAAARGHAPTDEAQAMEALGVWARLVAGAATNIKVTTASDLVLADAILSSRESSPC